MPNDNIVCQDLSQECVQAECVWHPTTRGRTKKIGMMFQMSMFIVVSYCFSMPGVDYAKPGVMYQRWSMHLKDYSSHMC